MALLVLSGTVNEVGTNPVTFIAGGAIPAYSVVKLDTSTEGQVIVTTAITEKVAGWVEKTAASGDEVEVMTVPGQIALGIVGAAQTIAVGDELMPLAAGAGTLAVAAGATAVSCGIAISAGAAGETIRYIFRPGIRSPLNP